MGSYRRFEVTKTLSTYIEYYWSLKSDDPGTKQEVLIPNGRPALIFTFSSVAERISILDGERRRISNAMVGISTQPNIIEGRGKADYFGVQFTPYGLMLLGLTPTQLVNDILPIERLSKYGLSGLFEQMTSANSTQRVRLFEAWAMPYASLRAVQPPDYLIGLVNYLDQDEQLASIAQVAPLFGISYQAMYRLFMCSIGISPKKYAEIMRTYRFIGQLINPHEPITALLAALHGYYDEAHASREFRRFTGMSQRTFLRTYDGIARQMHGRLM